MGNPTPYIATVAICYNVSRHREREATGQEARLEEARAAARGRVSPLSCGPPILHLRHAGRTVDDGFFSMHGPRQPPHPSD